MWITNSGNLRRERIYLGGFEIWRRHDKVGGNWVLDDERETVHISDDHRRICMIETLTWEGGSAPGTITPRYRFQFDNHLGTACVETDETGAVISYEEYHPYGTSSYRSWDSNSEVSAKRYRYTGKERDEETRLYYHGARYYAPWLGRWMSADPAGTVDGSNLFAYVRGSPVVLSDPSGMDSTRYLGHSQDKEYVEHLQNTLGEGKIYWSESGEGGAGWYVGIKGNQIKDAPAPEESAPGELPGGLDWEPGSTPALPSEIPPHSGPALESARPPDWEPGSVVALDKEGNFIGVYTEEQFKGASALFDLNPENQYFIYEGAGSGRAASGGGKTPPGLPASNRPAVEVGETFNVDPADRQAVKRAAKNISFGNEITYILQDAQTQEYLKVGRTAPGELFDRTRDYSKAARETGRRLLLRGVPYELPPGMTGESVEHEVRQGLIAEGHALPWDNTPEGGVGRLGRPGPGTPGKYQRSTARRGYRWQGLRSGNPTYRPVPSMRINLRGSRARR